MDFQKKRFENISKLNSLTACNTLSSWHGFNMDISLCSAVNDIGINFKEKSNDVVSYAVFEITDYISKNDIISMWTSGQLNVYFTQETQKDNMSFTKSVCIDEDALKTFSKTQDFVYYIMKEPPSPETRYYIVVIGNGAIDDIIIKKYTNLADMMSSHTKNINKLGFAFHELLVPNYTYKLVFDTVQILPVHGADILGAAGETDGGGSNGRTGDQVILGAPAGVVELHGQDRAVVAGGLLQPDHAGNAGMAGNVHRGHKGAAQLIIHLCVSNCHIRSTAAGLHGDKLHHGVGDSTVNGALIAYHGRKAQPVFQGDAPQLQGSKNMAVGLDFQHNEKQPLSCD
jgi:hypothetical protein